jgi:beta-galactosidase
MFLMTRRDLLKSTVAAPLAANASLSASAQPASSTPPPRARLLLDFGWRFHFGHAADPEKDFGFGKAHDFAKSGALFEPSKPGFDDAQWQPIDLPHDWAITLPFEKSEQRDTTMYGSKPLGRVFPTTSIGWYRKTFEIPAADLGRRVALELDGVFRNAMVVLNGHYLGLHESGYAPFRCDVTDLLTYGGKNILVVRVDATQNEGWFYEGAGIYRHVWLVKTAPLHVAHDGLFVAAALKPGAALVAIATEVANDSDAPRTVRVTAAITDPAGKTVATAASTPAQIPAWSVRTLRAQATLANPALWSIETPHLYRAAVAVEAAGAALDRCETAFGVRTIHFDPDRGFFLNGRRVEIHGTCNHQDHAGVGSALPDRIQSYRIEKLKEMGSNAYRSSHNPPTAELLDACDRLGMIVMDETRTMDSTPRALAELEALVRRDRNHPSIVLWSVGNEEPEQATGRGARIVTTMKRLIRRLDPTRPVTEAMNFGFGGNGVSSVVDVQGFNYNEREIDSFRKAYPKLPLHGSETASTLSTRGIYANDKEKGYVSAYDLNAPSWGSIAEKWWKFYAARPWLAGGFVWTGFDYRGEPTPYAWPCISSHFGLMDACGFPKDVYYYYQAWWGAKPMLHLFPHWNWKEGDEIDVWCFTNQQSVELFLNGQSLGARTVERNGHVSWKVKWAPGAIEARAGALVARRETTGAPARLLLEPDRARIAADGEDVSILAVSVVDRQGRVVPTASNEIVFEVTGAGKLKGVGNGDPSCHESDLGPKRSAFNGLAMAIVQAARRPCALEVTARASGLDPAAALIECEKAPLRPTA